MKRADVAPLWSQRPHSRAQLVECFSALVPLTQQRAIPQVPARIDREDLLAEGRLALVRAVDAFEPQRGTQFPSFAICKIRGAMLEYLRHEDWAPRSVRDKQKQLRAAEDALWARGVPVTDAALAAEMGVTLDEFYPLAATCEEWTTCSLDDSNSHEDDAVRHAGEMFRLFEWAADPRADTDREAALRLQAAQLRQFIAWLPPQERLVVTRYYLEDETLLQIARRLERSESRSHQIHQQALGRLRQYAAEEGAYL